ncbi:MAG: DUF521 domain-containing protein, partial [Rhodothermales bacterium]|nr:DUF521 domain-containing protein [Rhodothermales bacterium]
HLDKGRRGTRLYRLVGVPAALQDDDSLYPVLGHLLGKLCPDGVPVLEGLEVEVTDDRHKAVCAGAASSGAVALYHMVGITPEAPTTADAFGGASRVPEAGPITMDMLRSAYAELSTAAGDEIDMVVLGSPHFSLDEFRRLAPLVAGRKAADDVEFLVTCSRAVRMLAEAGGFLEPLRTFGGRLTVDTCPLTSPMLPERIKHLMTSSAKYAYYSPGLLNVDVTYGRVEDCVESAVRGRVVRDESIWST